MARGWESKSVEEQIAEKEQVAENAAESQSALEKRNNTTQTIERQGQRQGLMRAKARTVAALASVRSDQDRAVLERTLADLDARLRELD
jgi:hypothetical protein